MSRLFASVAALAGLKAPPPAARTPDLADRVAGTYRGDIIWDALGAHRSNVTVVVTRTGPDSVRVDSGEDRIQSVVTRLARHHDTIQDVQDAEGLSLFLADLTRTPLHLDLTIGQVWWSGSRTE